MHKTRLSENPGATRRTVLTSLSLLVSTNCALANGAGSFVAPTHFSPPSWHPAAGHLFHETSLNVPAHQSFGLSPQKHAVSNVWAQGNANVFQAPGLPVGSLLPLTIGGLGLPNHGYQLDLGSSAANVVLGTKLFNGASSVTVQAGGRNLTFSPGAKVTAAEFVAIKEVLAGGQQSIQLSSTGTAVGGTFSLNQVADPKLSLLVIPQTVTGLDYVSNASAISIHGDLVNYGSIYEVSTNAANTSGAIFAKDITNESGGIISSQLPGSLASSLFGSVANVVSGTSLILGATNNFTNSGTISSGGHLTVATNSGAITNNAGASLNAACNVNLLTGNGTVVNSGLVATTGGNINIASTTPSGNININAANGTFQATAGAINVRDASYTGSGNINMNGGNYQSQSLNLYTGSGAITGSVGQVTGTLNTSGDAAHFAADTQNLVLGNNCLKGDPTFANTGNITITGAVTAQEDLTIVAGGNITATAGASLSTANVSIPSAATAFNPSTNITLIAGAKVTTTGSQSSSLPTDPPIASGKTATVDFSSGTGGNIDLGAATIDTSSSQPLTTGNHFNQPNGGNVLLVAYANGATGGTVKAGGINTSSVNGDGGNVTIIAGANPGSTTTTVDVGDIITGANAVTNTTLGHGGNVSIYTQQPTAASGTTITFNSDGSVASGKVIPLANTVAPFAHVQLNNVVTGGITLLSAGNSRAAGDIKIVAGNVDVKSGGVINTQGDESGSVTINALGAVNTNGSAITTGSSANLGSGNSGSIKINAASLSAGALTTSSGTGNSGANAGNIYINTTGSISTGTIDASAGLSSTVSADVIINSGNTLTVVGATSSGAIFGRNVLLGALNGIAISTPGGAKTTDIAATGSVIAIAGSSTNPATISLTGGISNKSARPGVIELVNNSPTGSAVNLTIGGTITSDSQAQSGQAGSIAIVSSGAIKTGNISTTSVSSPSSAGARGGSVFISSGGTGANAITVGTINTSATTTNGASNVAGNVILLSAGAKTALNPANVKHGTITLIGGTKGVSLAASLSAVTAPDVIPATINISETITGANAINIRPGGYQSAQGTVTSINLVINNPDSGMVAPINVAASGKSLFLSSITQSNGFDNVNIVTGGTLRLTGGFQTSQNTSSVVIASLDGIDSTKSPSLNLVSQSYAVLFAPTSGISLGSTTISASTDVIVAGTLNTSNLTGDGNAVSLHSAIGSLTTSDINTFGTGAVANAGTVSLTALGLISAGSIDAASHDGKGGLNAAGGGAITITSSGSQGTGIKAGDLTNSGGGLIQLTDRGFRGEILTGDINSSYSTTGPITNVLLNGTGFVRTGDITTSAPSGNSGSVLIFTGDTGALTGTINTSATGGNAGSVTISGGGANSTLSILSINASTSGTTQTGSGGNVVITNNGGNLTWGPGGIDTSAIYSGAGSGNGGAVVIGTTGNIYANGISTFANNNAGTGNGGAVFVSGESLYVSTINSSAFGPSATSGTGGNVTLATNRGQGSSATGTILTAGIITKGITQGGSLLEMAQGVGSFIVNNNTIDTSSNAVGGSVTAISSAFISTPGITTSATTTGAGNVTGGSVMLVAYSNNVFIGTSIDTSASSKGGSAQGGSVGITSAFSTVDVAGINASATSNAGTGVVVGGDIFVSAAQAIGLTLAPVLNTSTTGGSNSSVGQIFLGSNASVNPFNFSTAGLNTPAPTTFANTNTISGSTATITVIPGTVNINPAGYNGIGSSATPVSLTLDFGGDSRLLVPIVSTGGIFVSGVTADNTTAGGSFAYQNNGYNVHLIDNGGPSANSFVISGDITSKAVGGGTQGNIQLADVVGTISQSVGNISGNSLTLSSFVDIGAILVAGAHTPSPINTTAASITADAFYNTFTDTHVYITTAAATPVALVGVNEAAGTSGVFSLTATDPAANILFAANSVVQASNITITAAGTSSALSVSGLVLGNNASALGALQANTITVNASGQLATHALLIETTSLTNNGSISTYFGALTIDNQNLASPNLTIAGTGTFSSDTALSLSAVGNIDFGKLIQGTALNLLPGCNLLIVSGGNITATGGSSDFSINTSSNGGNGGSITMLAGVNYTFPVTGTFNDLQIDTTGLASKTGGSIILDGSNGGYKLTDINTTSTAGAAGNVFLVAQGPASAANIILLPSNIAKGSITTGGLTQNGAVEVFALGPNSTSPAVVVGDINTGGPGFAIGTGQIDLETSTLNPGQSIVFHHGVPNILPTTTPGGTGSIQAGLLTTNNSTLFIKANGDINLAVGKTLIANDIELTSQTGTLNLPVSSIFAALDPSGNGDGGKIILDAPTITWVNSATTPLVLNADAGNGSSGNGGNIGFSTTSSTALSLDGNAAPNNIEMSARGAVSGGDGGQLSLVTDGAITVNPTFFDASVRGPNGAGGFLNLEGSKVSPVSGSLNLTANGVGNGNGGEIDITQSDTTAVPANAFQLTATSGLLGGDGGFVFYSTGGSLAVNPTQIKVNPLGKLGAGGGINLEAGNNGPGDLQVTAPIVLLGKGTGKSGGNITLVSNDINNAFVIGAKTSKTILPPVNGIVGLPLVTGKPNGTIDVENLGGDVTNAVALTNFSGITLKTDLAGKIILGASLGSTGTNVTLQTKGTGDVTTKSNAFTVTAFNLNIEATGGNVFGLTNTAPLTVSAPNLTANGSNVNILDKLAVVLGNSGATSTFTLIDTKNILSFSTITAPTLNLTSSGFVASDIKGLNPLSINTSLLTVSGAGTFNLNNTGATPITVSTQLVKSKAFTLNSSTDIKVAGLIGSTTGNVTLIANGTANVDTTGIGVISAKLLTVNAGGAVGSAAPLQANALTTNAASATSIQIDENAATSTLGNLTANNGSIDIKTAGTAAKILQTLGIVGKVAASSITATNGHITIENDNVSKGSIVIGKGSHIITGGTGGDVTISMGVATKTPGSAPVGVNFTVNSTPAFPPFAAGPFYFGTAGITVAGTKSTAVTIQMNSLGSGNVIFDTTTAKATAIKVNGNTTLLPTIITADPPILAGAPVTAPTTNATFTSSAITPTLTLAVGPALAPSLPGVATLAPSQNPTATSSLINTGNSFAAQTSLTNPTSFATTTQLSALSAAGTYDSINAASILNQYAGLAPQRSVSQLLGGSPEAQWASATELSNGEIPAVIYSEEDMGINSDVSTVVDLQAASTGDAIARKLSPQAPALASSQPLVGGVIKTIKLNPIGSEVTHATKSVILNSGSVVFAPTVDTTIKTPLGIVSVAAKSLVVVTVNRDGVAIYDLDDSHQNAVTVKSGNRELPISPGRHVLLTSRTDASFCEVNPAQMIGYRNIREHENRNGIKAFSAEFSLPQAVSVVQPLKQMIRSQNPRARKVTSHLLKTISILTTINTNPNGFQHMPRPRATAYAP